MSGLLSGLNDESDLSDLDLSELNREKNHARGMTTLITAPKESEKKL